MTTFVFDIDKTIAAAAYLTKKSGGKISVLILLKMMYDAEREALLGWHRPITGDSFYSMPKGIVLSRTYNLIKREIQGANSDMEKWAQHISPRDGNYVTLLSDPDFDFLSDRERAALDKGFDEITALNKKYGKIVPILHEMWPEWNDPSTGLSKSTRIDVVDILGQAIEDEDEVQRIALEIQSVQDAKAALQTDPAAP